MTPEAVSAIAEMDRIRDEVERAQETGARAHALRKIDLIAAGVRLAMLRDGSAAADRARADREAIRQLYWAAENIRSALMDWGGAPNREALADSISPLVQALGAMPAEYTARP
jgi:hypothetical protein